MECLCTWQCNLFGVGQFTRGLSCDWVVGGDFVLTKNCLSACIADCLLPLTSSLSSLVCQNGLAQERVRELVAPRRRSKEREMLEQEEAANLAPNHLTTFMLGWLPCGCWLRGVCVGCVPCCCGVGAFFQKIGEQHALRHDDDRDDYEGFLRCKAEKKRRL